MYSSDNCSSYKIVQPNESVERMFVMYLFMNT